MSREAIQREIKDVKADIARIEKKLSSGPMTKADRDRIEVHMRELEYYLSLLTRELIYAGI